MEEVIQEFLAESWENLGQLDSEIVELERRPDDGQLLASIFRTIHTIKGTCGFLGLTKLESVTHSTENVLGKMRDGALPVTAEAISLVLEAVDRVKELLQVFEETGQEGEADYSGVIQRLDEFAEGRGPAAESADASPAEGEPAQAEAAVQEAAGEETSAEASTGNETAAAEGEPSGPAAAPAADAEPEEAGGAVRRTAADLSIRVSVDVLDGLMNFVGELVLTRNELLQMARGDEESRYVAPIAHLNRITTDLQDAVMKTRMQPIGNAWSKLPRLVRDLGRVTNKKVHLEMSGEETELDRTVLDAIKDPLTHMVRNSADHGIESPEVRRENGKPEVGHVWLDAYHEGGHVIIDISDDGAGINVEKVRRKAIERNLLSEPDAERLSDNEIAQLVFHPGFSTAESVSSVSGRGVGMDVVKTQIESIGGAVDLVSRPGQGTTVKVKIPLTLAIVSALVVESGCESFAIPQLGVVELVRLSAEDKRSVERIHDREVLRLRDRLLPLVHLDEILELERADGEDAGERDLNIVVVQSGDEVFGLVVSEVFDTQEIVVKPTGSLLRDISIYQGTTILGDGRVIMILDVAGIAGKLGAGSSRGSEHDTPREADEEEAREKTTLLLFSAGETQMAVPLSLVSRLEEVERRQIERTGDGYVVQYRGKLLPVIHVDGKPLESDSAERQPVIVFTDGESSMGLAVDEIRDVLDEYLSFGTRAQRPGVLGTAIVDGSATDVIDTQHYLLRANPNWFEGDVRRGPRTILLVDDSPFYRKLVGTTLEVDGYTVTAVEDAASARSLLDQGQSVSAVLVDVDLPEDGAFEFARWMRSDGRGGGAVLVGLAASTSSALDERAREAGFDQLLVKSDTGRIVSVLNETTSPHRLGASA